MAIAGVCAICGTPATSVCTNCERRVCAIHYVGEKFLCTECAAKKRGGRKRKA